MRNRTKKLTVLAVALFAIVGANAAFARIANYCKGSTLYSFTYNSDGTIASMSWDNNSQECMAGML